jgi:hypothetical protein
MRTLDLKIELLSFWQAGSSLGKGAESDATALVDDSGLPYLPGRTVKGLLREAVLTCEEYCRLPEGTTFSLFGKAPSEGEPSDSSPGILRFDNAKICGTTRSKLLGGVDRSEPEADLRPALFEKISSTSIDQQGQAKEHTLRTVEVTLPVTLHAKVHGPADSIWVDTLRFASPLVKSLGSHRHRGLGRCRVSLCDDFKSEREPSISDRGLQRWYRIELLSDVTVTADAATEGGHDCLNYLPGSLLAGVVAGSLKPFPATAYLSGKMLFGDALPLVDGEIAYPVPLSLHKPKGARTGNELAPLNGLGSDLEEQSKAHQPVEQLRNVYMNAEGRIVSPKTHYRMKTAIDRERGGRAADSQLFGYQSIASGQSFAALVWCEDGLVADQVEKIVTSGCARLGRSRSAEYGQVRITRMTQPCVVSESPQEGSMTLFLVSDLALEKNGRPVLAPQGDDIGLPGASLDLTRSFLRTRRYTPWNAYHNTRMTERQVICHGSVLTFTGVTPDKVEEWRKAFSRGLGLYRQEGLGSILVNPAFVLKPPKMSEGGIDLCTGLAESFTSDADGENASLLRLLEHRRQTALLQAEAIRLGRDWACEWFKMLKKLMKDGQPFPGKAQWASLRGKAGVADKLEDLERQVTDLCTRGTRQHWWNAPAWKREPSTILAAVQNKLTSNEHQGNDRLGCLAMYNACVEVSRALSRGECNIVGEEAHK